MHVPIECGRPCETMGGESGEADVAMGAVANPGGQPRDTDIFLPMANVPLAFGTSTSWPALVFTTTSGSLSASSMKAGKGGIFLTTWETD